MTGFAFLIVLIFKVFDLDTYPFYYFLRYILMFTAINKKPKTIPYHLQLQLEGTTYSIPKPSASMMGSRGSDSDLNGRDFK